MSLPFEADDLINDTQAEFARRWFGYGRWAAPYWFVGMEPGGDEAADNLTLWEQAGRPELSDLTVSLPGQRDWFGPESHSQSTWAKLIWLLLAYEDREPSAETTLDYQRKRLGRIDGDTALLELSPFAATSLGVASPREIGRNDRVATIATNLRANSPRFVVFYSANREYAEAWKAIVGASLTEGQPILVGSTACVMTYHPQHERGKAYWVEIAHRLRNVRKSRALD